MKFGDLNGDNIPDLVGRVGSGDPQTGHWFASLSSPTSGSAPQPFGAWGAVNWVDTQFADFNGDGKLDMASRIAAGDPSSLGGQWWVGLSSGSDFVSTLWTSWHPRALWVNVHSGRF